MKRFITFFLLFLFFGNIYSYEIRFIRPQYGEVFYCSSEGTAYINIQTYSSGEKNSIIITGNYLPKILFMLGTLFLNGNT
jgi:hypothetical protein